MTEGNLKAMVSFLPSDLETEASFQSQKRKRHSSLRKSRLDGDYDFEVQWKNTELTKTNPKPMEIFSPTALEGESSARYSKREKHATLRRSRLNDTYGFESRGLNLLT